jgi:putative hydrolase of the HAD superfamily
VSADPRADTDRAPAVVRRREGTCFSSQSDDELGGLNGALRAERAQASGAIKRSVGCAAVKLDWVLFDADGVIQGPRPGSMEELTAWGGSRAEEFLLAVAAADVACLTGQDFGAAMQEVLQQFEIDAPFEDVIDRRFWIEVRQPMLAAVREVRDLGLHCGLATNQQNLRGAYMRGSLGFETIFDMQFYSFELGFAKPDTGYFRAIMDRIGVAPDRVLFIDDHEDNVAGACDVGIHGELFPRDGGVAALKPILAQYGVQL